MMKYKDLNINGNWRSKKAKLMQNFAELTNDDLRYTQGQEEQLINRIQLRLEIPETIAEKLIRYS